MKKYPMGIREEVVSRVHAGESQRALSREYEISRYAIQSWLKEPALLKIRGRKPASSQLYPIHILLMTLNISYDMIYIN